MKNSTARLAALAAAHGKLSQQLFDKQEEYAHFSRLTATSSAGQRKLSRLAREIESLANRLDMCERLQERALTEVD